MILQYKITVVNNEQIVKWIQKITETPEERRKRKLAFEAAIEKYACKADISMLAEKMESLMRQAE